MAEETAVEQEANTEELREFNNTANVLSLIAGRSKTASSALGKMSDYAQKAGINKPADTNRPAPVENVITTPTTTPEASTETVPAVPGSEVTTSSDEVEIEGLGKLNFGIQKPATPTEYKTLDDVINGLGKKWGITAKDVNDFADKADKAFTSHRASAQKVGELEAKQKDISDTFAKMPDDLREGFLAWTKGENYKEAFRDTGINYNKTADQHDPQALVNQFFPNKFTKEDFEDHKTTPNPAIEIAVQASTNQFNTNKSSRETAVRLRVDSQIAYKAQFDASVDDSVSRISADLPFLTDKSAIESLKGDLANLHVLRGTAMAKEFLKTDGTLRDDAASRWALAKHGKQLLDIYAGKVAELAASKATENVVAKGADVPSQHGGHNVNSVSQTIEQKKVEKINTFKPKKSVYS